MQLLDCCFILQQKEFFLLLSLKHLLYCRGYAHDYFHTQYEAPRHTGISYTAWRFWDMALNRHTLK